MLPVKVKTTYTCFCWEGGCPYYTYSIVYPKQAYSQYFYSGPYIRVGVWVLGL